MSSSLPSKPLSSPVHLAPIHSPIAHHTISMRSRQDSPEADSRTYDETLKAGIPRIFSASRALQSIMGLDRKAPVPFLPPPPLPEWGVRLVEQWRVTEEWNQERGVGGEMGLVTEDKVGWGVEVEVDEGLGYGGRDGTGQDDGFMVKEGRVRLRSKEGMKQYEDGGDTAQEVDDTSGNDPYSSSEHSSSQHRDDEEEDQTPSSQTNPKIANCPSGMDTVKATPTETAMDSFRTIPTIIISSPPSPSSQSTSTGGKSEIQSSQPCTSPLISTVDQNGTKPHHPQNSNKRTNTALPAQAPARKKRRSLPWSLKPKQVPRPISYTPDLTHTLLSWFQFSTQAQHHGDKTITRSTSSTTLRPNGKTKTLPKPLSIPPSPSRFKEEFDSVHKEEHPPLDTLPPHWTHPPKTIPLLGLSLWTLTTPDPTELLRFEPGDVETLRWVEVDTWSTPSSTPPTFLTKMLRARKQYLPARWTCLVIRKHKDAKGEGGHWTVAWPRDAVTGAGEVVKYVQESTEDQRPVLPEEVSDVHLLHPTYNAPKLSTIPEAPGGVPLRRTTLYFDKAGQLPLVEAMGVHAGVWEEWIEAVGMGCARVMVWTRPEERILEGREEGAERGRGWLGTLWEEG